ncbi:hypothetical protein ACWGNE_02355 [Streptomyces xiamenensis]
MTAVTFAGRVTIGDRTLRCPGTGAGLGPSRLRLVATGGGVRATCDKPHKQPTGKSASCWWVVDGLTAADLSALAEAKPGRVRATLSSGAALEGKVVATDGGKEKAAKTGAAKGAFAKLMTAAKPRPAGKASAPAVRSTTQPGGGGSAAVAAFGALAAVAGALGSGAKALGDGAKATASIVGSGATVASKSIDAVDKAAARRFADRHTQQAPAPVEQRKK